MLEAYKRFWKNYVNFNGQSSRSDYWWVMLWHIIIYIVLMAGLFIGNLSDIQKTAATGESTNSISAITMIVLVLTLVYIFVTIVPNLALIVRRLRDAAFSWAFIFLLFIPYVGGLTVFILNQFPTKKSLKSSKELLI